MLRPWRVLRQSTAAAVLVALPALPAPARADPQASVGLTLGVAGEGYQRRLWNRTAFHLGLHGDILFGRDRTGDFGVGPYLEVFTHAFDELQFGGGLSGLLPVLDTMPLILSAGAYGRKGPSIRIEGNTIGLEPGIAGELFWGSRSYNFHAKYVLSGGLLAQLRCGLGPSRETSIVIAAQIDVGLLAIPVLFLITAARGKSPEAAPLR